MHPAPDLNAADFVQTNWRNIWEERPSADPIGSVFSEPTSPSQGIPRRALLCVAPAGLDPSYRLKTDLSLKVNTGKLDLKSISEPQARGPADLPYYHGSAVPRLYSNERLPALHAYTSGSPSSRVSSIGSTASPNAESQSSFTTVASSDGPTTPPSSIPVSGTIYGHPHSSAAGYEPYPAMNPAPADMYYSQHPPAQQPQPQSVAPGTMPYHTQHPAPLLQPASQYSAPTPYSNYGYANGLTSPPTGGPITASMGGPGPLPLPGGAPQGLQNQYQGFDTTGQIAPPGMKPRVTATLWEDEGSLCFQVEARGICVARREGRSHPFSDT